MPFEPPGFEPPYFEPPHFEPWGGILSGDIDPPRHPDPDETVFAQD